ncbi:hypothetical protein D1AOALGA4SA_5068 [Olavius algarvensis Delta 1 endosymbiont]|nr:hypothetical protein D1AOALGA4SA_5068 [Olavius algarvensis Delta 1 endosymbiont]
MTLSVIIRLKSDFSFRLPARREGMALVHPSFRLGERGY